MNTDQVNSMLTQDNRKLRELLWLRHGCMGLYGGDGEMLCASCGIDFKQDSVGLIEGVFKEHGMRKLVEAQVEKERLAREARTEKTYLREKTAKFDPNDCAAVMCSTAGQHPNAPNAHTVQCAHCKEHDRLKYVKHGDREWFSMVGQLKPSGLHMDEIRSGLRGAGTTIHGTCWGAYKAEHPEAFEPLVPEKGPGV